MGQIDRTALVTAAEAASLMAPMKVTRHTIAMWVQRNRVQPVPGKRRGRSPLYRWGDLIDAERDTRLTPLSSRNRDRVRRARLAEAA